MIEHRLLDISLIELLDNNPRTIEQSSLEKLSRDIELDPGFLHQRPSLINFTNGRYICYAGQQRVVAQKMLGRKQAMCFIESDVPQDVQDRRMVIDNTHRGEWDIEKLKTEFNFTVEDLQELGIKTSDFSFDVAKDVSSIEQDEAKKTLQQRFIVPPFSVLDTRQGYWQDRKRVWEKIGLKSQETREEIELVADSGQSPEIYKLRNEMRAVLNRDPTWAEILDEAKRRGKHVFEGASIFDPVLCEIIYTWFCPPGAVIIDPFAGGSVRGIVAGQLGFQYHGIDLRADQVEANKRQAEQIGISNAAWYSGDSNTMDQLLPAELTADFVFSCPPYHDLEQYSDNPVDLSNMGYPEFMEAYRSIITKSMRRLKPNRFACFVVGDIRNEKGIYRNFVSDTIDCFTKCIDDQGSAAGLYNEIILLNVAGSLPVRVNKQFQSGRKVGKTHQNVLVFYKGDPKAIKSEFGEVAVKPLDE